MNSMQLKDKLKNISKEKNVEIFLFYTKMCKMYEKSNEIRAKCTKNTKNHIILH